MSKVLYIKANIKKEGESRTYQVADHFIEAYKKKNPQDEVTVLDLYEEKIDFLQAEDLGRIFGPKTEASQQDAVLKYAYQFAQADKYIIAAPMWNLSIPAILKAYIDYVSVTGITFKYTAEGPVGLLNDKKAVHIVSRGGVYTESPYEMGDRYLKTIFAFFGITDMQTIEVEGVDFVGADVKGIVEGAMQKAETLVETF